MPSHHNAFRSVDPGVASARNDRRRSARLSRLDTCGAAGTFAATDFVASEFGADWDVRIFLGTVLQLDEWLHRITHDPRDREVGVHQVQRLAWIGEQVVNRGGLWFEEGSCPGIGLGVAEMCFHRFPLHRHNLAGVRIDPCCPVLSTTAEFDRDPRASGSLMLRAG